MQKINSKKPEPKLEYLQDPNQVKTPRILKPLYDADEKIRQKLSPENLGKEIKKFGKHIKKKI
jgi:hypothetical protein